MSVADDASLRGMDQRVTAPSDLRWGDTEAVVEVLRARYPNLDPRGENDETLATLGAQAGGGLAETVPTSSQLELVRAAWWWGF